VTSFEGSDDNFDDNGRLVADSGEPIASSSRCFVVATFVSADNLTNIVLRGAVISKAAETLSETV
jgi:hypothetical protein